MQETPQRQAPSLSKCRQEGHETKITEIAALLEFIVSLERSKSALVLKSCLSALNANHQAPLLILKLLCCVSKTTAEKFCKVKLHPSVHVDTQILRVLEKHNKSSTIHFQ